MPSIVRCRPEHLISFLGTTDKVPYYPDANQAVLNPPVLWINNTGGDTIDAVRVETTFLEGYIDSRGKPLDPKSPPKDWYKVDTPVILRRSEKDEHVLQRQLPTGMSLGIPLLRGVLAHIAQAQSKNQTDSMHYARLKTAVSAGSRPVPRSLRTVPNSRSWSTGCRQGSPQTR